MIPPKAMEPVNVDEFLDCVSSLEELMVKLSQVRLAQLRLEDARLSNRIRSTRIALLKASLSDSGDGLSDKMKKEFWREISSLQADMAKLAGK